MRLVPVLSALFIAASAQWAVAHEFWIDPQKYQVESGEKMQIDLRNGQEFKGVRQAFYPKRNTRFEFAFEDAVLPVQGRLGDRPAMQMPAPGRDGLLIVLHEAAPSDITYKEWEKFLTFAKHKDFPNAAADHAAAGWSMEKFGETYTRHSKSLIAIGAGTGADKPFGLETEFVALTNPYDATFNNQMKIKLYYQSSPRADAQVEVFDRAPDETVTISLHRTDDNGEATIPVTPGHSYLFDAVVLRPAQDANDDPDAPVWETLWAALTFAVPE